MITEVKRFVFGLMLGSLSLLGVADLRAFQKLEEGGPERAAFTRAVYELFVDEEFELLDRMADKLLQEKSRFPDGTWKLAAFYRSFHAASGDTKVNWHELWARFGRWEKKNPQSATARVMHAQMMANYAWEARGGGFADTVSGEGWNMFADRLRIARDILEADAFLKKVPGYYSSMMLVALGQGWPKDKAEALFIEAAVLARDYEDFYFRRAYYLQPKWHGEPGEWLRFAEEAAETTKEQWGRGFYARVVWGTLGTPSKKRYQEAGIDWAKFKQGFEDLVQRTPDSLWNKNAFCYFACMADDRETARRLFEELQDSYAPSIWGEEETFAYNKRWAKAKNVIRKK